MPRHSGDIAQLLITTEKTRLAAKSTNDLNYYLDFIITVFVSSVPSKLFLQFSCFKLILQVDTIYILSNKILEQHLHPAYNSLYSLVRFLSSRL